MAEDGQEFVNRAKSRRPAIIRNSRNRLQKLMGLSNVRLETQTHPVVLQTLLGTPNECLLWVKSGHIRLPGDVCFTLGSGHPGREL